MSKKMDTDGDGFFVLRRKMPSIALCSDEEQNKKPIPLNKVLAEGPYQAVSEVFENCYSKTKLIGDLYKNMMHSPDDLKNYQSILWALLTDHGLLAAQTRECGVGVAGHSKREITINGKWYRKKFRIEKTRRSVRDTCADKVYQKYLALKQGEPCSEFSILRWEPISDMLNKLLDECQERRKPVESVYHDYNENTGTERGYCEAEISQCYKDGDLQQVLVIRAKYIDNVHLQFQQNSSEIPVLQYFNSQEDPLTQHEMYELVSNLIPTYISAERIAKQLKSSVEYEPVLFSNQIERFHKQEKIFESAENLTSLKDSLPALESYLRILFDATALKSFDKNKRGEKEEVNEFFRKMQDAFKQYAKALELKIEGKENEEDKEDEDNPLLTFIAYHWTNLVEQPMIIFQLWRHPYSRSWSEAHLHSFQTMLQKACCEAVPITPYTLKADGILFSKIVDLCKESCSTKRKDFNAEAWKALWHLIELTTKCLNFSPANMLYESELLYNRRLKKEYDQCFTMSLIKQDA